MSKSTTTYIRDTVKLVETVYEGGLIEIGVYIKAIWPTVQPVLVGVVSSQKVEGMRRKWHCYDTDSRPRVSHHIKSRVVDAAVSIAECKVMDQRKQFGAPLGTF